MFTSLVVSFIADTAVTHAVVKARLAVVLSRRTNVKSTSLSTSG